jgi:hypothetical protein
VISRWDFVLFFFTYKRTFFSVAEWEETYDFDVWFSLQINKLVWKRFMLITVREREQIENVKETSNKDLRELNWKSWENVGETRLELEWGVWTWKKRSVWFFASRHFQLFNLWDSLICFLTFFAIFAQVSVLNLSFCWKEIENFLDFSPNITGIHLNNSCSLSSVSGFRSQFNFKFNKSQIYDSNFHFNTVLVTQFSASYKANGYDVNHIFLWFHFLTSSKDFPYKIVGFMTSQKSSFPSFNKFRFILLSIVKEMWF